MTVRVLSGNTGLTASTLFFDWVESVRLIVPLGLTRPVPWTRPPLARPAPVFFGCRAAGASGEVLRVAEYLYEYSGARI